MPILPPDKLKKGSLIRIWRQILYRPRLVSAFAVGIMVFSGLRFMTPLSLSTAFLAAWNLAASLYLGLAWSLMFQSGTEGLARRAELHDEGEGIILLLSVLAAVSSLMAILAELAVSHGLTGWAKAWHIGLAFITILSSWAFIHTAFSLHYAHAYYRRSRNAPPPLIFPGAAAPLYPDFLYFGFVIGTSGQTADVSFACASMRQVGLVHCIVSFAFNTTIVALMINLAASLIASG